ncbi:unnamed protein product, partial [Mesorhabditis belari]|uniref:Uncharacterized protein n=1 Tax=Mesorhabditis belari TaxID=2138241 RepID=A0AAF3EBM2_9BILA
MNSQFRKLFKGIRGECYYRALVVWPEHARIEGRFTGGFSQIVVLILLIKPWYDRSLDSCYLAAHRRKGSVWNKNLSRQIKLVLKLNEDLTPFWFHFFAKRYPFSKIHLNFAGVSFYKRFKQKQLAKELQLFEKQLQEHERLLSQAHTIQSE